uniref:WD repeat domain phosphoinositide-interacting protein 3 n=1 Tax=Panagrellus redivivus TaxID=6233 RepID=A0A7E4WBJ4_PANRE
MATSTSDKQKLIGLTFNQDGGCFGATTKNGYSMYNAEPLKMLIDDCFDGGMSIVEMLFRCHYVALVGTGQNVVYPQNKVIIWDSLYKQQIGEIVAESNIKAIKLRRDKICVVLDDKILVYSFSEAPELLSTIETAPNTTGICALSASVDNSLLAYPAKETGGIVKIVNLAKLEVPAVRIKAHNHAVAEISFNFPASLMATASEKGTLIRIYDTDSGTLMNEFRRGSNPAKVLSIAFSLDSSLLAVASSHSTVHVFSLMCLQKQHPRIGTTIERYFKGDVSFLRLKISPTMSTATVCKCAFDANSESVIVVCSDGSYHRFAIDRESGKCVKQTYSFFIELTK